MIASVPKPVDRILITKYLSTEAVFFKKLFKLVVFIFGRFQTGLNSFQMVDSKKKNGLIHKNGQGLSTIAIDL